MKCPNCEETLVMTERQGVEIDYCPKCRGVWLDKGELDKIVEKSQEASRMQTDSNRNVDRYDDDDDDDNYRGQSPNRRRRGGFLGNLFDFDLPRQIISYSTFYSGLEYC
jgi:Zn-finger nucleic acid-binding protein